MPDISSQLIDQVKSALDQNEALNIVGRGSKQFYGRNPTGKPIEVAGHSGIVNYQPDELVLTVRAGTSLPEIQDTLEEHGQMLSFEPPNFGTEASIGGTLACHQSGPSRPWLGSVRDMVLGVRLINGRGEHLRFGGQVMKNVAGYDVSRLVSGSLGCLGIITEISLKVLPKPGASLTLAVNLDSAGDAITAMNRLSARPLPVTASCWLDGELFVRFQGASRAVDQASKHLRRDFPSAFIVESGSSLWTRLRDHQFDFFSGKAPLWRFSVASNMDHLLPEADWLIDWGGAQRWLKGSDRDLDQLNSLISPGRGEVCAFLADNRDADVFPEIEPQLQTIYRRLKTAFDPDRIFNPGRMYSWL